jgi:hypothetical protein
MLRFDLPHVPSNVIRWEAFVNAILCVAALLVSPWFMLIPAAQGLIKGFVGHGKCPAHIVWRKLFVARGWQGRMENAGPKMFAGKVLMFVSCVALGLYLSGSPLWIAPVIALLVFSCLEWSLSFCAACWVYGVWYRYFPAGGQ